VLAFKFERLEEKETKQKKGGDLQTVPGTAALFIHRYIDGEL